MDINQLIREQIQQIQAEDSTASNGNSAAVAAPAPAGPITVNIQGQPVTFRDQADLEAQLNQTAQAIRNQQPAPQPPQDLGIHGARVSGRDNDTNAFSPDKYIELMNKDPRDATNYALSHMLFDGQVDDAASLIRESMVSSATQARQLAAYQFRDSHREVPIENPQVGQTIDNVRKQLNLPFTEQGLDAAYAYAVNKGFLPDFRNSQNQQQQAPQQPQQFQQPQQPVPQNSYLNAPPAPGRNTSGSIPVTEADLDDMSIDQLKRLMTRMTEMGAV